jgi:gluconolactonase
MGEVERGLPGFEKFSKHLASRNYKALQIKSRVLENTGHSGNKAEGYARGLQYIFERPSLKLNADLLKRYEGQYQTSDSKPIEIKKENDKLALYVGPGNKYILNAANESDFYATSEFLNIKFKSEKEDIWGFELKHYGGTQFFNKKSQSTHNMEAASNDTNIIAPGAQLQRLSNQFSFTEGPAVDKKGNVFFTDQPNDKIWKYGTDGKLSVFLDQTGRSNGMYFDKKGNLLTCADEKNEIWSISPDKKITVLFTEFEGKKLNGPNDLWVDKKGGIYFTDPYYQRPYWTRKAPEIAGEKVYYLAKGKKSPIIVDDHIKKPNGIVGTPDGKHLYVADIGDNKTYRYVIGQDGTLKERQLFVSQGSDGMTLDHKGNLYLTGDGVTVYNSQGKKISHIPVPAKWTANVCFYGKDKDHLFITASESVYILKMNVRGVD